MAYKEPKFSGNKTFSANCTGDCCVGDVVAFERAVFTGSWRKPKFSHFEMVTGKIVKDSYGLEKQQHTFTLKPVGPRGGAIKGAKTFMIKGRNLYRNGCWRKPWDDEAARAKVLEEKHERGKQARVDRQARREEYFF